MSKKDVYAYYNKMCNDYSEMINTIHELEEYAQNGMVSPEKLENMKLIMEPLKQNYMKLS